MSMIVRLPLATCVVFSALVLEASAERFWNLLSPASEATGTVASAPMTAADEQPFPGPDATAPLFAQAPADDATTGSPPVPQIDESALRYFARQGDARRLEIEIARLRALYPDWTPPADPLAVPPNVDERLEAIWMLYSEGRLAEARRAIAQRQSEDPDWEPPADLLERLAVSEARERLLNASDLDQYETVVRVAAENPSLLTCSEVDVMWRVGEAFARTERPERARDAYRYILANCDDPGERLATMQNAASLLPDALIDDLLSLERTEGTAGEFDPVRDSLSRSAVARGGEDADLTISTERVTRLERLARDSGDAADARLLGWYYLLREDEQEAEEWFRLALESEDEADASQGLALTLIARGQHAEAEAVLYRWRSESDDTRAVYLAAVANLLGDEPRLSIDEAVLRRMAQEVGTERHVPSAQQFGWYARAYNQFETARQWFETALSWDPDDEPSAYGLALTRQYFGEAAGVVELQRIWAGRSERIARLGEPEREERREIATPATTPPATATEPESTPQQPPAASAAPSAATTAAAAPSSPSPRSQPMQAPAAVASQPAARSSAAAPSQPGCTGFAHPESLSPDAALQRGWCLMDANRPSEAARFFAVALRSASDAARRDAGYGQSLAYLRSGLVEDAARAAASAPQSPARAAELQSSILAERALGAFEHGRFTEAILYLDQRSRIAAERNDLMVLRGYAYLRLRRLADARRVFEAVAGTGNREGLRGLAAVNEAASN